MILTFLQSYVIVSNVLILMMGEKIIMNCKNCGTAVPNDVTACPFCGEPTLEPYVVTSEQTNYNYTAPQSHATFVSENIFTGTIGALIGALIGGLVIVLLGQVGLVASISGWILAICTLRGYLLLGRDMSKKGLLICLILIVITPYFANRLDWALAVLKVSEGSLSVFDAYSMIPDLLKYGYIEKFTYAMNLIMVYVFAALGGFSTIRSLFQ